MKDDDQLIRFADFSQEEIRKFQLKLVGILEALDAFCKKNNLRYYLTGGTCIGAVRHKGFIPWDCDLDVALPREDYEKLFQLWDNENNRFKALRPTKDVLTGVHIGQIRDSETTCIYEYARNYDICQGVKIDVEPIDGCPNGRIAQIMQRFFCLMYGLMSGQRVPNHGSNGRKMIARIILPIIRSPKIRYKLFSFADDQVKKYKVSECDKIRVAYRFIFDKEVFDKPYMTEFEGRMYPLPSDYDTYLKELYGNYMEFPYVDDCKPTGEVYFYDLDTSYIQFKGIKYLVK